MEEVLQNDQELPERPFTKQLAATVSDIQWSYAIFWALTTKQEGVLAWRDGYYNGDIKTRKTTQETELQADQMSTQRSEQLRELYCSLLAGDSNPQSKRPSASLSPEDLTAMEWYYVVCMSFTFSPGEGLPGRTLTSNQHIWVSNAPVTDSQSCSRYLLAKSASVLTIVCFPYMDGVIELGTTELILEDPALIQHVRASLWELPKLVHSETSRSNSPVAENEQENMFPNLDPELVALENHILMAECQSPMENGNPGLPLSYPFHAPGEEAELMNTVNEFHDEFHEQLKTGSPDDSFTTLCNSQHIENTLRMEEINRTCKVLGKQMMDDGFLGSFNSSASISKSLLNPQMALPSPKGERPKSCMLGDLQEGNYTNFVSKDFNINDSHYTKTLSDILRNSKQHTSFPEFCGGPRESSFSVWKRDLSSLKPLENTPQKLLKKILVDCVWMHNDRSLNHHEDNGLGNKVLKSEWDGTGTSHVISERKRREKLNEKFIILKSMVPFNSKVDKASILGDTIKYIRELERNVEEFKSRRKPGTVNPKGRQKHLDITERTSDNYGSIGAANCRKDASKRKASNIYETEYEDQWILMKDTPVDVNVTMTDKEVLVEMQCPSRDCLLLEIIEATSSLHLNPHTMQSSITEGIFALTLKAKVTGPIVSSPERIKRSLQRVVRNH